LVVAIFVVVTEVIVAFVATRELNDAIDEKILVVVTDVPVALVQTRPVVVTLPKKAFQRSVADPKERTRSVDGTRSVLILAVTDNRSDVASPIVVLPLKIAVPEAPKKDVALTKLPTAPPSKVSVAVALAPRFVTLNNVSISVESGQFVPFVKQTF